MLKQYQEPISRVAVIGAGTMGAAIAQHFLMKHLDVVLIDVRQEGLDKGVAHIGQSLGEAVERKILTAEVKDKLLNNLKAGTDYALLADRQFVVEAVFEDMLVKQAVYQEVEKSAPVTCIIGSNTSSFSITELASVMEHQARFVGVHYFYHAAKNKLIEVIPGKKTTPEVISALTGFYYDIDKAPIVVKDVYGFAVNRFFVPWLNEAVRLYEEGFGSIPFIDKVAEEIFNIGMGPFALMNATGVPITMHASRTLEQHFGSMYTPAQRLVEVVKANQQWDLADGDSRENNREEVSKRLLAMSLGVAAQMVDEGVAGITETDLGARLGLRWPLGPFELINSLGVSQVKAAIAEVFAKYDQPVPANIQSLEPEQGFILNHVQAHVLGRVGLVEFNRPDSMNALSPSVMDSFARAFRELDGNPDLDKIVLFGRGKAFVAGADIKFFLEHIKAGTQDQIYSFTAAGQALLKELAASSKRTIAYVDGLTLGGGLELALACDERVATSRFYAAFPETGIGIYPGLGGTQRTTRLVGKALSKYLVATGQMINAEQALSYGLVCNIIPSTNKLEDIAKISAIPVISKQQELPELVFEAFDGDLNSDLVGLEPYKKVLSKKAPVALRLAMQLIEEGADLALDQALQLELDHLLEIFATRDAETGLSSLVTGSRPQFEGL